MSELIERAELIDKNMAQAKEIERLQKSLAYNVSAVDKADAQIQYLQARVERLTADLNESERQTRAQLARILKRDKRIDELIFNMSNEIVRLEKNMKDDLTAAKGCSTGLVISLIFWAFIWWWVL